MIKMKKKIISNLISVVISSVLILSTTTIELKAYSDIQGPTFSNLRLENVSETGFDVVLDVQDNGSGVNIISLPVWRSGNYQGMEKARIIRENIGNGTKRFRYSMEDIGAGSDYIYVGIHLTDYAGNYTFGGDIPLKLDSVAPNMELTQNDNTWTTGSSKINIKASDNFNVVEKIRISGNNMAKEIDTYTKPKILSLTNNNEGRNTLNMLITMGYDVVINPNVKTLLDLQGYDVILYDGTFWRADGLNGLLNQAYNSGYRIFSIGNDTAENSGIHPIKGSTPKENIRYGLIQYKNQYPKENDESYNFKDFDNIMKYYNGETESDSQTSLITSWESDTRPIAMNSAFPDTASILYSSNNNGGKWIHMQFFSLVGTLQRRIIDELMVGLKSKRQIHTEEFEVTENGIYTVEAEDFSGNITKKQISVRNIDREAPILTLTPSTAEWTNKSVDISVRATDSVSGVKQIKIPNGNIIKSDSATYTVSNNGTYEFEVCDNVGNITKKQIKISNMDTLNPDVALYKDISSWTKNNVNITINTSDSQSGIKEIKLPNGDIIQGGQANFVAEKNGEYVFEVYDRAKNKTIKSIFIDNIDKTSPLIELVIDNPQPTNGDISIRVKVEDKESGFKSVDFPDGRSIKDNVSIFVAFKNGVYSFKAVDVVGNVSSKSIEVKNIDNMPPTLSLNRNPDNWTNKDVVIEAVASDLIAGVKEIKLPNGNVIAGSRALYNVVDVGVYYFEAVDYLGNRAIKYIVVDNIDKQKPTLNISNSQDWNNERSIPATITAEDK